MKNEKRKDKKETSNRGQAVKNCSLLFVFCFILFVFSCENTATPEDNMSPLLEGKGSFLLTLSEAGRTILPVTPNLNDFAVYNLDFTPTNNGGGAVTGVAENADRTNGTLATAPVLLEPGIYKLMVNAYKDANKTQLMAQGTLNNITITAGKNTPGTVTLEALLSGGTGTFKWDITLPAGVTANMLVTPGNVSGTNQQTVTLSPPKATGSRTLNSGQYGLTFNLTKTDGKAVVWNELLHVYQNLESVFTFTFTDAHLSDSSYTVTYNYNDGVTSNLTQSVLHGATLTAPTVPTRSGYTISGWYTDSETFANTWDFNNAVIESFILYAKWEPITIVPGATLAAKLSWLQSNALSNVDYTVEVSANESIAPHTLSYSGRSNIGVTLIGVGANRIISLSSNGAMFTVSSGVTLVLDNNIILNGHSSNTNSLVRVNYGGTLIMNVGSTITGNTYSSNGATYGGGVYVDGGTFIMSGGEISSNTSVFASASRPGSSSDPSSYGGGVYVGGNGTFTMNGTAKISGNTSTTSMSYYSSSYGGGVYVDSGTFTMEGGEITDNTTSSDFSSYGGGVYVGSNGIFTMSGTTKISDNTATSVYYTGSFSCGGGVYVDNGTFTMTDGKITGNTAGDSPNSDISYGGGVYVSSGTFTMEGGEITGNNTTAGSGSYGGGVYVSSGSFTMESGKISGNTTTASSGASGGRGGGVYVGSGTFTMTGGEITVNTSSTHITRGNGQGGGVHVAGNGIFTMEGGTVSGNTALSGGGVYVERGTFTMTGGTFSGNTAVSASSITASSNGGGVYVTGNGTFAMTGGEISGNTAKSSSSGNSYGGGVYVGSGTFTMSGTAIISGNTASGNGSSSGSGVYVGSGTFTMSGTAIISGNTAYNSNENNGGGVYVNSGTFTMEGGEITSNTCNAHWTNSDNQGGGVYVTGKGTFTMEGGIISGHTVTSAGGGVYVGSGTFTMSGTAIISGNTVDPTSYHIDTRVYGGGVYMEGGTFTMNGGTIAGNTLIILYFDSSSYGGGVYMENVTFNKIGGTIYGYSANDTVNSNKVVLSNNTLVSNNGHAVYAYTNYISYVRKRMETTTGPEVDLSFSYNGSEHTWSGGWDY